MALNLRRNLLFGDRRGECHDSGGFAAEDEDDIDDEIQPAGICVAKEGGKSLIVVTVIAEELVSRIWKVRAGDATAGLIVIRSPMAMDDWWFRPGAPVQDDWLFRMS